MGGPLKTFLFISIFVSPFYLPPCFCLVICKCDRLLCSLYIFRFFFLELPTFLYFAPSILTVFYLLTLAFYSVLLVHSDLLNFSCFLYVYVGERVGFRCMQEEEVPLDELACEF